MIKNHYYYEKGSKYKKLTGFDITIIVLGIIALLFVSFYLSLAIGYEDLVAMIMFSLILPISFTFASHYNKKMRLLDFFIIDENNSVYYVKVIDQ